MKLIEWKTSLAQPVGLLIYYFWLCWAFVAADGLSLVAGSGGSSLVGVCGLLWCEWFTGLVALQHVGSSQTRDELMSPAVAGGFLTTGPPGKPLVL